MKLKHKKTGKIYFFEKNVADQEENKKGFIYVRTNAEVYPEDFYDFSPSQLDGCTMYYVKEPLSDFEIIGE